MIVNKKPYPLSFEMEMGQSLVFRYGEEGRQYAMQPDVDVSGLGASLQIVKPDNTFVIASADVVEPEKGPAYIVITVPLQATVVKGIGHYSIFIQDEDMIIYSAEGQIWIDDHLITDDMIESASEVYGLRFPQDFLTVDNLVDIVNYVSANLINDETIADNTTWSSQKIEQEISGIEPEPITATEQGNPIETTDAAAAPLVKCVTEITGYQEGTGTPSPDNIRPIVAYISGTIEVSDGDGNTTTHTTTYPAAIYRGSEDVVNGTETHDMVVVDMGDIEWVKSGSATGGFYATFNLYKYGTALSLCSSYNFVYGKQLGPSSLNNGEIAFYYNLPTSSAREIYVKDESKDNITAAEFNTAVTGQTIAFELATPTTSPVTPTNLPIRTLSGYNHIESSTGEMEVEYLTEYYEPLAEIIDRGYTHNYSAVEHVVGKWIDDSPVYEKTISFGALPNNTTKSVAHGISNLDMIITCSGWAKNASNTRIPIPYVNISSAIYQSTLLVNDTSVQIMTASDLSSYSTSYITIRYTKTS